MNKIQGPTGTVDAILNTTSGDQLKCQTYCLRESRMYSVSKNQTATINIT